MTSDDPKVHDVRKTHSVDGVELQYEILGEGPPLVLLHGGLVGRSAFSRMREDIAKVFTMILPSSRGHDGTDLTLPKNYGFDTSELSDLNSILEAEKLEQVHLLGHSSGGCTAFAFALNYPEKVNRLVLIEPTLINLLPPTQLNSFIEGAKNIFDAEKKFGSEAALRACMDVLSPGNWYTLDETTKTVHLERLSPLAPFVAPHWKIILNFVVTIADLKALEPPTQIFYGSQSFYFEPFIAAVWREIRSDLPLIMVEGAGHDVHHDRPDVVNSKILKFLGQ